MIELLLEKRNYALGFIFLSFFIYIFTFSVPRNFPIEEIVTIERGSGLAELALRLEEQDVVRSAFWFRVMVIIFGGEYGVRAGEYYLDNKDNTVTLAWRMVKGKHNLVTERITIPEGYTAEEITALFDHRFPFFDPVVFKGLTKEGYMFPDTYFIQVNATAYMVNELLENNFRSKIKPFESEIVDSGFTEDEIIILASIIESEARTKEARQVVSGILRKRLSIGMGLQVDATLGYVTGRTSAELTQNDLNNDNPYNTYKYRGLPPGAISNPGLESIEAALRPTLTPYLYFLTGDDGEMHYARTFDEHVENKRKYIR